MSTFNRGLDEAFVEALNDQYQNGWWWRQFVDDKHLFLAVRYNQVHVYYRGCRLIEVGWRNGQIVANTHYKYLLRSRMGQEYVEVEDGTPSVVDASAYFVDRLSVDELKRSAERYVGEEKKGVHDILQNNPYILDVEVAMSDGEGARRVDFAALQQGEAGQTHIVFYEAKHFDNRSALRSSGGTASVVEQIADYRRLLKEFTRSIAESYRRVSANLRALEGVPRRHPERHDLLERSDHFVIETEPGLVVFGFDGDQKSGAIWKPHKEALERELHGELILHGEPARLKVPTR